MFTSQYEAVSRAVKARMGRFKPVRARTGGPKRVFGLRRGQQPVEPVVQDLAVQAREPEEHPRGVAFGGQSETLHRD